MTDCAEGKDSKNSIPNCICCSCDSDDEQDICIVEASDLERSTFQSNEISKTVWGKVRPPVNIGKYQPIVTARRTEIIRAQLIRNLPKPPTPKPTKVYCQCEPNISKMNLRCT